MAGTLLHLLNLLHASMNVVADITQGTAVRFWCVSDLNKAASKWKAEVYAICLAGSGAQVSRSLSDSWIQSMVHL